MVDKEKVVPVPAPWRALPSFHVGGLTDVGFAESDGQEFLLVVSHNGRGVFDFDGNRVARDDTGLDDTWHDARALTAQGIGPLEGVRVPIVGLSGGGFPLTTGDDWSVAHEDEGRVELTAPDGSSRLIHNDDFFEVRAVGFSLSGKAIVIATAGECYLFTRS
ncbi:hypothetical protein OJ997_23070 [Solirubrobacter phytolaccae]|uniref:Uncharacterized protein n=1 Tax=Solirubrobacter phytolaccae TaxID=1404360 RepID=A0A9X3NC14_9ACTN|nr:hypothetical protein [Solirubrobacter phytolaccae]MDA0183211.1 hypothetical protein [Solirubrobacter phytolaccae]